MKNNQGFKIFAVVNFIVLLTLFLLFKQGMFDNYFKKTEATNLSSPNGGTATNTIHDSTKINVDSIYFERMVSSKSMVVFDAEKENQRINKKKNEDSLQKEKDKKIVDSLNKFKPKRMPSSKSGAVFEQTELPIDTNNSK